MPRLAPAFAIGISVSLMACATPRSTAVTTVDKVDLPRFMGAWYVVASIPTFIERDAFNAVESYALDPDGSIATTFTFHRGAFDGPLKTLHPRGFVRDAGNAVWGMQFLWPIKAEYRIAYLDPAYSQVVIARSARDYVWIMSRRPDLPPADYERLVSFVASLGYDTTKLRKVPQHWP